MSRSECSGKLRKGAWTADEDMLLRKCVEKYGEGKWRYVPERSGLRRCRKSCRLRWLNYLCPRINREKFSDEEDDLIIRLHKILGNRWSLIAGRLPGRTANDVKNYWNSHLSKKVRMMTKKTKVDEVTSSTVQVVRPQPRRVPLNWTASSSQSMEETAQTYCRGQPPSKPCTLGSAICIVPEDNLARISSMIQIHGGEEALDVRSWLGLDDPEKDGERDEDKEGLSFGGTEEWDAMKEWEDLLRESTSRA